MPKGTKLHKKNVHVIARCDVDGCDYFTMRRGRPEGRPDVSFKLLELHKKKAHGIAKPKPPSVYCHLNEADSGFIPTNTNNPKHMVLHRPICAVFSEEESKGKIKKNTDDHDDRCVLCSKVFTHEYIGRNNAHPLTKGECCDECNLSKVIPTRMKKKK